MTIFFFINGISHPDSHDQMPMSFIWTLWLHLDPCSYVSFAWHVCVKLFPFAASLLWNCGQQWEVRLKRFPLQIKDIRFCLLWIPFAWKINIVLLSDSAQSTLSSHTGKKDPCLWERDYVSSKILKQKTRVPQVCIPFCLKQCSSFFGRDLLHLAT